MKFFENITPVRYIHDDDIRIHYDPYTTYINTETGTAVPNVSELTITPSVPDDLSGWTFTHVPVATVTVDCSDVINQYLHQQDEWDRIFYGDKKEEAEKKLERSEELDKFINEFKHD